MKEKSRINSAYEFKEDLWVISLINTGTILGGHSKIVIEGIKENSLYIVECHAMVIPDENEDNESSLPQAFRNTKGTLRPLISEKDNYKDEQKLTQYSTSTSTSYYIAPANADLIINEVKKQIEEFNTGNYMPYQYSGDNRIKFFGSNDGHNCTTWAESILKIGGIERGALPLDYLKALPEKHASPYGCAIF